MPVAATPVLDRIFARTERLSDEDCWIWKGALSDSGYGVVQLGRGVGTRKAHRVVYEALVGPIPEGLSLDHLCFTPACVNPAHLEPVTRSENTLRQHAAGRFVPPWRGVTHCKREHKFTDANTYHYNGHRHCRACQRLREGGTPMAEVDVPDWSKEKPSDGGLSVEVMQEIALLRTDEDEPIEPAPTGAEEEAEAI